MADRTPSDPSAPNEGGDTFDVHDNTGIQIGDRNTQHNSVNFVLQASGDITLPVTAR